MGRIDGDADRRSLRRSERTRRSLAEATSPAVDPRTSDACPSPQLLSSSSAATKPFALHSARAPTATGPKIYVHLHLPNAQTSLYTPGPGSFVILPSFRDDAGDMTAPVVLDPSLTQVLRPHQKEGLAFLFHCVCGLGGVRGNGCILADEMGLGKTLTAIALVLTALTQSPWSTPLARSAVVTCPSSLVANWGAEFT